MIGKNTAVEQASFHVAFRGQALPRPKALGCGSGSAIDHFNTSRVDRSKTCCQKAQATSEVEKKPQATHTMQSIHAEQQSPTHALATSRKVTSARRNGQHAGSPRILT